MKMFRSAASLIALVAFVTLALPSVSHAGLFGNEVTVKWADVPTVVQGVITAHADNGKVEKVEKEVKNNKTIYEARVKTPTHDWIKVKVAENGQLIELRRKWREERDISWKEVPAAVQQAFTANAEGGKVKTDEVEIDTRNGVAVYEGVAVTPNKVTIKMKVSADGKLLEFKRDED